MRNRNSNSNSNFFSIFYCLSWCFKFISLIVVVSGTETLESLEVQLEDGPVRGYPALSYDNRSYVAFEGIPYAQAPIGELRFQSPVKPTPWTSPLSANKTYVCMQFLPIQLLGDGLLGQEDCLYVNVYVPGAAISTATQRNVVVHIHGGAFVLGAPKMMAGPRYIMNEDVIYVSFNYRLNLFGFLSTNDDAAAGNWGLKDQNLALQWTKANIAKFGGDPASITLTGQSAGGASVHYHVLSQKSKGLFARAVLISGTALNPWALTEDPLSKAQKLADIFNCPTDNNIRLVECLRGLPARTLGIAMKKFYKFGNVLPVTPFGPTVEHAHADAFITKSPYHLLKDNEAASDVPMIISFVRDEGIFPSGYFASLGQIDTLKQKWYQVMQYGLDIQDTVAASDWPAVLHNVKEYYYPGDDLSVANIGNLTQMWTDRFYFLAIEKAIRLHVQVGKHPVFVYFFDYDSPAFEVFRGVHGVAHSEDLQLMFNLVISPSKLTPEDEDMSHFLTKMLRDFATESKPSDDWLPMKHEDGASGDIQYYEITKATGNKMAARRELAPSAFWTQLPIREEY